MDNTLRKLKIDPGSLNIILMGSPGAGKSTQAEMLVTRYNLKHISTGKIYRELAETDTDLGRKVKQIMNSGGLIDDETTYQVVDKNLRGINGGYLIDGYPRTIAQAKWDLFDVGMVIFIHLPDDEAISRMLKRGRADDTEESLRVRFKLFHHDTEPILQFYREQGKLFQVDGVPSIEEVSSSIIKLFEE